MGGLAYPPLAQRSYSLRLAHHTFTTTCPSHTSVVTADSVTNAVPSTKVFPWAHHPFPPLSDAHHHVWPPESPIIANSADATWFGLSIPEAGVIGIDTSATFGWCGSPNIYCAFGNGISWRVSHESPATICPSLSTDDRPFWGFNNIGDHVLIEHDVGIRLSCADSTLRLATLGPDSLNLDKFTSWPGKLAALGLHWDLDKGQVSMPYEKICKAKLRLTSCVLMHTSGESMHIDESQNHDHFSINVREHFCVTLAIAIWGPLLADPEGRRTIHVRALTDNTSALVLPTTHSPAKTATVNNSIAASASTKPYTTYTLRLNISKA
ncbi:hypothetical protein H257_05129 [Aphanomyces astaci]|uniref:Uncharacterized protein n=1 Tax=Aphanomyces astaci TaxID=112090 RepID=W4GT59_APHAT|nr:hypothetical protein H257_05129 [Aphanomyces astaci]ETV82526.1 hypothetical protein H257_05129 [Aphanomyces astaci]|eukprot:XP_009828195.1 hypothetical protein H257_05129 [Aphanomyces astaci]